MALTPKIESLSNYIQLLCASFRHFVPRGGEGTHEFQDRSRTLAERTR
jgi:hypothetical protein